MELYRAEAVPSKGATADGAKDDACFLSSSLEAAGFEMFTEGIFDVGAATPIVAPIFIALRKAKGIIDGMEEGRDDLSILHDQCTDITKHVIQRCNEGSVINVIPLLECVEDVRELAKIYSGRGTFRKMLKMVRHDRYKIRKLQKRIERLVPILGLGAVCKLGEDFALLKEAIVGSQNAEHEKAGDTLLVAPVPIGRPADKAWHVVRDPKVEAVYSGLCAGDEQRIVGLVGRSGSGKTTCAASIVGEPAVGQRRAAENPAQTVKRLNRIRTHFCDGVIWLRVGRGAGAAERLPVLMGELAKHVHKKIAGCEGYRPGASPNKDGSAYIQDVVTKGKGDGGTLRCLVVTDDVWEPQVVEQLRETGMSVLLTSRDDSLVEKAGGTVVVLDQLTDLEAEFVLRGAAELPAGVRLPKAAERILERCEGNPMHLEFVGRWSNVRHSDEEEVWGEAGVAIEAEERALRAEELEGQQEQADPFEYKRLAILRAGFNNLAALDPSNRAMYMALAIMPDGRAFGAKEAAVFLFDDWEVEHRVTKAGKVVGVLEQWAVVRMNGSLFRMHDAHAKFSRSRLTDGCNEDVRRTATKRWQHHISSLDAIVSVECYELQEIWRALEVVGGKGWRVLSPYSTALRAMDDADPQCITSLNAVVSFYIAQSEWERIAPVARRLLRVQEARADDPGMRDALVMLIHSANGTDRKERGDELRSRLSVLLDSSAAARDCELDMHSLRHVVHALGCRGLQLDMTRRVEESRETFRRSLRLQEDNPETFSELEVASTLEGLATVLHNLSLDEQAAQMYRSSLQLKEKHLGHASMDLMVTLHNLACILVALGEVVEAESMFRRSLTIAEVKSGPDNMHLYRTIGRLATCMETLGRHEEARDLRERASRISERAASANSAT